jgi:NAD(P)-dependent dehydrogenase (short-subunit alcohol dehydrogenase family)|tara:strand:- start:1447 stop:2340 length:894 start_codon:yes stop_codon:yes gene_type:complete
MQKANWTTDDILNVKGKVAVVTGGNSGLGKETARVLAQKGVKVILAVRSTDRGEDAAIEIRREFPKSYVEVMKLDLSSLASVKSFAKEFLGRYEHLDFLINNAGVMVPPYTKTEDGFELQFGTNHLAHFALTGLLLPLLESTEDSRIVTISSVAHLTGDVNFHDLAWEQRKYDAPKAYADSKIANLYFTYELARKLNKSSIRVLAAHPGWTSTNLQKNWRLFRLLNPFFAQKPEMGALPTLRAATDPDAQSGDYFGPSGWQEVRGYPKKVASNKRSNDKEIAEKLWRASEKLTGIKY